MRTAFLIHADFRLHTNWEGHPERPERLDAIEVAVREIEGENLVWLDDWLPASEADLRRCHTPRHVEFIRELAAAGGGDITRDTRVMAESFEVASLAVGAAIAGAKAILQRRCDNAFVAVRPPGHHAETEAAMGFCLFNNVACAARSVQEKYGIERVAILDWDVHHGNGTQEIFYEDSSVFFASLHQSPLFPGTGGRGERGAGAGEGSTINYPLPPGTTGEEFQATWALLEEPLRAFEPQFIIVSAGFDAHRADPLGGMELTTDDYAQLARTTRQWAADLCEDRLLCVLEGGYNVQALGESVRAVVEELMR